MSRTKTTSAEIRYRLLQLSYPHAGKHLPVGSKYVIIRSVVVKAYGGNISTYLTTTP